MANDTPAGFEATFNDWAWDCILGHMEENPNDAVAAYKHGKTQALFWPGQVGEGFASADNLVRWHQAMWEEERRLQPSAGLPENFSIRRRPEYLKMTLRPFHYLVTEDAVETLRVLHAAGHWDPLAYDAEGDTYFHIAVKSHAEHTIEYIKNVIVQTDLALIPAVVLMPQSVEEVTGSPSPGNYLDLLLQHHRYDVFKELWELARHPPGQQLLSPLVAMAPASIELLMQHISKEDANTLREGYGLNLATHALQNPNAGTVWHIAAALNPDATFLDFLADHSPQTINDRGGRHCTPIEMAYHTHMEENFTRLLVHGADPDHVSSAVIARGPTTQNTYFKGIVKYGNLSSRPDTKVRHGTFLHQIIQAYHASVENLVTDRTIGNNERGSRKRLRRTNAERTIRMVLEGDRRGRRPDLRTMNMKGEMAIDLARKYGYTFLYDILRVDGQGQNTQAAQAAQGGQAAQGAQGAQG